MTVPGVGPIVSLAYAATIDIPARFRSSRAVGAVLGLTPILNQSGESNRIGHVSRCGDGMLRTLLYEAAQKLEEEASPTAGAIDSQSVKMTESGSLNAFAAPSIVRLL